MDTNYSKILLLLKEKIQQSRLKTILHANAGMIATYWIIGDIIASQEAENGWGGKTVDKLARDLKNEFPDFNGLSPRNLRYMRDFAKAWPQLSFLQQEVASLESSAILQHPVAKLSWSQNIRLLSLKNPEERLYYANMSLQNGWNRDVLSLQIESQLFTRKGKLSNNFANTLPPKDSDLAHELFKDPYNLGFFELTEKAQEKDLENALIQHMAQFLLEMGKGFAFLGRQVHCEVDGKDYYIDLLLYHTKLHRHIVIELKIGEFKAEYAGKMNLYLSAIDSREVVEGDQPSIGLILCKSKSSVTVEYALRDLNKPIGVAELALKFTRDLPISFKSDLPSIEDLELELSKEITVSASPVQEKLGAIKAMLSKLDRKAVTEHKNGMAVLKIFEMVRLLERKISEQLQSTMSLFLNHWIAPTINTANQKGITLDKMKESLSENTQSVGIYVCLEGLIDAGEKNFDLHDSISFKLEKNKVGVINTGTSYWSEKSYNDLWTEDELDKITERFCLIILGRIEQEINKI
jgi:predicted nuclease of restriction endonuclease-like (RecB) superfamily